MTSKKLSDANKATKAVIICGATGSGKSELGMKLAAELNGEIISADSRQIYRKLDIGTAKPSVEDRQKIRHHLIDIVDVTIDFTAKMFADEALKAINSVSQAGKMPIIIGGAGLYLEALVSGLFESPEKDEDFRKQMEDRISREGLPILFQELVKIDPQLEDMINPNDSFRIIRALEIHHLTGKTISWLRRHGDYQKNEIEYIWLGLDYPRDVLYDRINKRVDRMIISGLIDEVNLLLEQGLGFMLKRKRIVGYYEIVESLEGNLTIEEGINLVKQHSRNYAKRQLTWFRHKAPVIWLNPSELGYYDKVLLTLDEYFKKA